MNEMKQGRTFRRFREGETTSDWELEQKIFNADHSHKCPTYVHKTPPCQGSCPSGHEIRGWLAIARGMDKPPVEGMAWQEYAFQRMAEHRAHMRRPGHAQPGIGGPERCKVDAARREDPGPGPVRAEPRPAGAAERQDRDAGLEHSFTLRRLEAQRRSRPARPAPAGPPRDPETIEPRQPGAQERRGLHRHREHPARRAGEELLPEAPRPALHRIGIEVLDHRAQPVRGLGIGGQQRLGRQVHGQVEPGFPRHQELATHRRLGLDQGHRHPGPGQNLGRHQPGGTGADHHRVPARPGRAHRSSRSDRRRCCSGVSPMVSR